MTSDQKQSWMKVRLLAVARLLVASIVTASFLITVAPLGTASSAPARMKDCCIGKPGHEAGSCSSGLFASTGGQHQAVSDLAAVASDTTSSALMGVSGGIHSQSSEQFESSQAEPSGMVSHNESGESEPHPNLDKHCGVPPADPGATEGIDVDAGVMGMTHGANSSADLDDVTIDASDHCKADSQSEDLNTPPSNDPRESASIATQSFSKPCSPECGTGALSSGVRRSHDSAAIVSHGQSRPPVTVRKRQHFNANSLVTSAHCKQLRPRGPPLSFN